MMRKGVISLLFMFLCISFFNCSSQTADEKKILAKINNYDLSLNEFQYQLAQELELEKDFKLTDNAKREFLEEIIRKELLIQKAKKLKLDRKENFIRSIERYWESTLIRNLIDLKSEEITRRTFVSQEEIETWYKEKKALGTILLPLNEVEEQMREELKERKKTEMLKKWITNLRENAQIEIFEELL